MFRFIIRGKNCADYIGSCLDSLVSQTVSDWYALIVLDPSDDGSTESVLAWGFARPNIRVIINKEQRGVCWNMFQGLQEIGKSHRDIREANNDDIICILDLDDYLYRNNSLEIIAKHYRENPNIMCTYGSFRFKDNVKSPLCKHLSPGKVRKDRWVYSHMKTFRYGLVKHIPQEYFMYDGEWGRAASDLALMFCVIELAGKKRCKFVKESVYYYRNHTPKSLSRKLQKHWEKIWRKKAPLSELS